LRVHNAACEGATFRFTYWLLSEAGSRGLQQGSPQEIAANPSYPSAIKIPDKDFGALPAPGCMDGSQCLALTFRSQKHQSAAIGIRGAQARFQLQMIPKG